MQDDPKHQNSVGSAPEARRPLQALDAIPDSIRDHVLDLLAPYRLGFQEGWDLKSRGQTISWCPALPASSPDAHAVAHWQGVRDGIGWRMEVAAIVRRQMEAAISLLDREGVESPVEALDDEEYVAARIRFLLKERDPKACPVIEYTPPPPISLDTVVFKDESPKEKQAIDAAWREQAGKAAILHTSVDNVSPLSDQEKDDLLQRIDQKAARRRYTQDSLARVLDINVNKVKRWLGRKARPEKKDDVARITAWLDRIS